MIKAEFDKVQNTLYMEITQGTKTSKTTHVCRDQEHAQTIWRINVSKTFVNELHKWLKQRIYALHSRNEMTPRREYAAGALQLMLTNYGESHLQTLVNQIVKHADDFEVLRPHERSRYYNHYVKKILPIREWSYKHKSIRL